MMGLQATATKRKYEMSTYDDGDMETNCSPAKLSCRWAATNTTTTTLTNLEENSNEITSITTTTTTTLTSSPSSPPSAAAIAGIETTTIHETHSETAARSTSNSVDATTTTTATNTGAVTTTSTVLSETNPDDSMEADNDDDQTVPKVVIKQQLPQSPHLPPQQQQQQQQQQHQHQQQPSSIFLTVASQQIIQSIPPPPSENSIAKLEAVTVPGETWNAAESPIDSIQKLQAVAVPPCDRSTLATTLLSPDELDDDDDFEDDFDDDETTVPSYPSMRYPSSSPNPYIYIPPGYQKHFIHYKEPYSPQQSCQKNQNYRNGPNPPSLSQSQNHHYGSCNYYYPPSHPDQSSQQQQPQQQPPQQTIRCAENGKSYLELGSVHDGRNGGINGGNGYGGTGGGLHHHHHHHHHQPDMYMRYVKRCCEGKSNWCNSNKQCYREKRHKMMNLSMFKLSRFRQLSEQNMLRSVLICNTLKLIEKEIKAENKECRTSACGGMMIHHNPHSQHGTTNESTLNKINTAPSYCQPSLMNGANNNVMSSPVVSGGPVIAGAGGQPISNLDISSDEMFSNIRSSTTPVPSTFNSSTGESPGATQSQMNHNPLATAYDNHQHHHHQQQQQLHQHPLRDQSPTGRATPFPMLGLPDTDSGFGDEDCTRPINWGSVLSLSSQSALDPINNNDLFTSLTNCSSLTSSSGATASACWGDYNILESDFGLDSSDLTELVPSWKLTADEILKSVPPPMEPSKIMMDNEIDTFTHIMVGS